MLRLNKFRNSLLKGNLVYNSVKHYWTGQRYTGYVSYFQNENLFGFVVREDVPEKEYYFHATDLHAESIPRVRPFQQVEFSIMESKGGNYLARDISSVGGSPIVFNHANLRLSQDQKTKRLSSLEDGLTTRHKGIVVSVRDDGSGIIVPDRLNYDNVFFSAHELQTTGKERVEKFSEVEFFVRPNTRNEDGRDRAVCITRPGGGLITSERRDIGSKRRVLGQQYTSSDSEARIPSNYDSNRELGYISEYLSDKLYGFIVPFDNPSISYFVHIDDCHMYGKRDLRRFEPVEFTVVKNDESDRVKAMHVTGPNKKILKYINDNHYIPNHMITKELKCDTNTKYIGEIVSVPKSDNWFIIKPCDIGYKSVLGFKNNMKSLGRVDPRPNDYCEFELITDTKSEENRARVVNITAGNDKPFVFDRFDYGKYLRSKLNSQLLQEELPLIDNIDDNTIYNGFISSYNINTNTGTIEIECPISNQRYRKLFFDSNDFTLIDSDNINLENYAILSGQPISCKITEYDDTDSQNERNVLKQRANNITDRNNNTLTLKPKINNVEPDETLNSSRSRIKEL